MTGVKNGFTALLRDSAGNVLPMAAVGMVMLAALVGGGIDMSRAYRVENRLQSACDAAALAGRRAVDSNGYNDSAQDQAESYFKTNFDAASMETTPATFTSTSDDNGQTVKGTASTSLNLAVMQIFGFKKFDLAVECQASMGVGNSDVMMVLDTTGSMGYSLGSGTRISALRTAMKNFYTTVKTATQGTNSRIRYGFVPFSSSVNVGKLLHDKDPSYLVDSYEVQSRLPVKKKETTTRTTAEYKDQVFATPTIYSATSYKGKNSCGRNLPRDDGWENDGPPRTLPVETGSTEGGGDVTTTTTVQPQKRVFYTCEENKNDDRWYIYSNQVTRDYYVYTEETSTWVFHYWNYLVRSDFDYESYKNFEPTVTNTGSRGSDVTSTWGGCIEERNTQSEPSFSFSTITGITPNALDLDIDLEPTSDPDTQWAPMWPEVAFRRNSISPSTTGYSVDSYCPYKAQLLTTMTQGEFDAYADALYPVGSTYLDIGMTWGGRLSSPDGIFSSNVKDAPANGGEVSRHLIFMSDGDMDPSQTIQSAWGIESIDRRVTDDGSDSQDKSRHISRFLALCAAIKAKGIRIWTISFTTGVSSTLQTCASTDSAFNANDATELNAAFQEIAKQVGELRLTQ